MEGKVAEEERSQRRTARDRGLKLLCVCFWKMFVVFSLIEIINNRRRWWNQKNLATYRV